MRCPVLVTKSSMCMHPVLSCACHTEPTVGAAGLACLAPTGVCCAVLLLQCVHVIGSNELFRPSNQS